ncbi:HAD family hydrolase [Haloarculaceae archaeon H-GB2-1]|nr:HAD family hydrolase [Haloarculaceae archaeon H-GB1-1]MEA5385871.1 HAD family hydrolase [Haloarculaceae archaeon H-GB11]MEA5407377.1 HAD family hydrolase [Haloarculaceae archaeon H-GB2-1]
MTHDAYDFWLFDLDGTIVDIEPSYVTEVFEEVGDRLGRSFTEAEAETLWYGNGGSRDQHLRKWGITPEDFWAVFHEVEDPRARAESTYLYDDAGAFVRDIDGPVGVVTHCQPYLTGPVLDTLDIRDWFDAVVCCTDDTGWKPDPEPVELAMRGLDVGYNGHTGVLAGDDANDVGAAWNAGLDAVHVERKDPHDRGQCVLGDHRIRSFEELKDESS